MSCAKIREHGVIANHPANFTDVAALGNGFTVVWQICFRKYKTYLLILQNNISSTLIYHRQLKSSPWRRENRSLLLYGRTWWWSSIIVSLHYNDVIMGAIASQITTLTVVYSTVYSGADQRKHQSSASLAFVRGIHRDRWIPRTKGQ